MDTTTTLNTSAEVAAPTTTPSEIEPKLKAELWKDQITGEHVLKLKFRVTTGGSNVCVVSCEQLDDYAAILKPLRKLAADIPSGKTKGVEFLERALGNLPKTAFIQVPMPGWNEDDFVLPRRVIGKRSGKIELSKVGMDKCSIRGKKGDISNWKSGLATACEASSFLTFAILVGFAAPLRKFSDLSEGVIFNLSGVSSVGKTTVSRAALSLYGSPSEIRDMNATVMALEDEAAAHNDLLFVLDDTEKADNAKLPSILDKLSHVLPEGKPKSYSRFFGGAEAARRLRWRCTGLTSSPSKLEAIYSKTNKVRSNGQRLRLVDIPIPSSGGTGVFDRVEGSTHKKQEVITRHLKKVELTLKGHYGVAIEPWIRFLQGTDVRSRLQKLSARFVKRAIVGGSGPDKRLAQKFGLVYGAGILAVKAKLLPLESDFIESAVLTVFKHAREEFEANRSDDTSAQTKLYQALGDATMFPVLSENAVIDKGLFGRMVGFRRKVGSKWQVAISAEGLERLLGSRRIANDLLSEFRAQGHGLEGHGGKPTRQYAFRVKSKLKSGKAKVTETKPRFHVFKLKEVRALIRKG